MTFLQVAVQKDISNVCSMVFSISKALEKLSNFLMAILLVQ